MNELLRAVLLRALRAFVSGALAAVAIVAPMALNSWNDLAGWLTALGIAAIVGGVNGVIMAVDKWVRWQQ